MYERPVAVITNALEYAGPGSSESLVKEGFQIVGQDKKFADEQTRVGYQSDGNRVVSLTSSPEELIAETMDRYGRIDAVISNDFAITEKSTIDELDSDVFRATLEILTVAPMRLCSAAAGPMKKQRRGHIVLITSGAGVTVPVSRFAPGDVRTDYVVGRQAANTLARCTALELAPFNIQVNAVAPQLLYSQTFFPSPMGADDPQFRDLLDNVIPMGRFGTDQEIGELVALLASGRASFVSGQVIAFSGAGA